MTIAGTGWAGGFGTGRIVTIGSSGGFGASAVSFPLICWSILPVLQYQTREDELKGVKE